jgi:hypothetical protein
MQFVQEFTSENREHQPPFKIKTKRVDFRGGKYDMDENGVLYNRFNKEAVGVWDPRLRLFSQGAEDIEFYYEHSLNSPQNCTSDDDLIEVPLTADVSDKTEVQVISIATIMAAVRDKTETPFEPEFYDVSVPKYESEYRKWEEAFLLMQNTAITQSTNVSDLMLYQNQIGLIQGNEFVAQELPNIHPHWSLIFWASSVHDKLIEQLQQRIIIWRDDKEQDADVMCNDADAVSFYDKGIEKMESEIKTLIKRKDTLLYMDQTSLDNLLFRIKIENMDNSDIREFFEKISF